MYDRVLRIVFAFLRTPLKYAAVGSPEGHIPLLLLLLCRSLIVRVIDFLIVLDGIIRAIDELAEVHVISHDESVYLATEGLALLGGVM